MSTTTTTTTINHAAYVLSSNNEPLAIREAPTPNPSPSEILVNVKAVAINPVDAVRASQGLMIKEFPWIIGSDGSGIVVSVGGDVKDFAVGDRVTFLSDEWVTNKSANASFQQFCTISTRQVAKIPDTVNFADACVLPLGLTTAAGMLFEKQTLAIDFPSLPGMQSSSLNKSKVLIIWGGSSSVGASAIQLASAAGYTVVGIASKRNFELMRTCGVSECLDYNDEGIVDHVCEFVSSNKLELAGVAAVMAFQPDVIKNCGIIASRLPGNKFVSTALARHAMPEPKDLMPEGVQCSNCYAIEEEPVNEYIWGKWFGPAMAAGLLKCLPEKDVVGQGLDRLQEACERMGTGTSGRKLVVEL